MTALDRTKPFLAYSVAVQNIIPIQFSVIRQRVDFYGVVLLAYLLVVAIYF